MRWFIEALREPKRHCTRYLDNHLFDTVCSPMLKHVDRWVLFTRVLKTVNGILKLQYAIAFNK